MDQSKKKDVPVRQRHFQQDKTKYSRKRKKGKNATKVEVEEIRPCKVKKAANAKEPRHNLAPGPHYGLNGCKQNCTPEYIFHSQIDQLSFLGKVGQQQNIRKCVRHQSGTALFCCGQLTKIECLGKWRMAWLASCTTMEAHAMSLSKSSNRITYTRWRRQEL